VNGRFPKAATLWFRNGGYAREAGAFADNAAQSKIYRQPTGSNISQTFGELSPTQ